MINTSSIYIIILVPEINIFSVRFFTNITITSTNEMIKFFRSNCTSPTWVGCLKWLGILYRLLFWYLRWLHFAISGKEMLIWLTQLRTFQHYVKSWKYDNILYSYRISNQDLEYRYKLSKFLDYIGPKYVWKYLKYKLKE